ncbi:hypothetical protein H4219_002628 [Mycoemilia scoparia]|uniref:Cation/H+ exchanger transmembrane domain-containing protein n=1 Tax=Mycoemilia scoparia TaxID=417184 RepID=A0A9W8A0S2_9FUNG|nr:hypothetical protein H4219_002628 [Mycoemilia scoparia]
MAGTGSSSVITGLNPMKYNPANPIPLFLVQILIIICLCRLLHVFLYRLMQPRVIAEIIAGILLGPTVLGRWKAFKDNVFPTESLTVLNLVSNFGLILFLFMVGLELDPKMLKKNMHKSLLISIAGMILPFALGIATSYALFKLIEKEGSFVNFLLFCGVAMAITAFPVLARILTELRLLKTTVGSISISAAAVDDVVSWCLLALVVALTNNSSGLSALWVFLAGLGWTLFVIFAIRPIYIWFLRRQGCLDGRDPPQRVIFLTFTMVFISAFFTDVIGIHAIFGGFIIGIIVPHDGGFAIKITEKIEDLVVIFFLPIYFALSGLKTNLSDLNDGVTWGLLILIIFVAFFGKIVGCAAAAKFNKFTWRESLVIGFLMNCKGLVELIVLNIGLEAGVINTRIFTMMVVKALVTTFATTPVVAWLYPPKYQQKLDDDEDAFDESKSVFTRHHGPEAGLPMNTLLVLNRIRHVPAMVTLINLLHHQPDMHSTRKLRITSSHMQSMRAGNHMYRPLKVFALRLFELTGRDSSVMRHAESEILARTDPILSMFRAFARVAHLLLKSSLVVAEPDQFAESIISSGQSVKAHLTILQAYGKGPVAANGKSVATAPTTPWYEAMIGRYNPGEEDDHQQHYTTAEQTVLVTTVFEKARGVVAVFVDRGLGDENNELEYSTNHGKDVEYHEVAKDTDSKVLDTGKDEITPMQKVPTNWSADTREFADEKNNLAIVPTNQISSFHSEHNEEFYQDRRRVPQIVLPFFGGPDDRKALELVTDLCTHSGVSVTVIRYVKVSEPTRRDVVLSESDFPEKPVIPPTPAAAPGHTKSKGEVNPWDNINIRPELRKLKADPEGYRTPAPEPVTTRDGVDPEDVSKNEDEETLFSLLDPRSFDQSAITEPLPSVIESPATGLASIDEKDEEPGHANVPKIQLNDEISTTTPGSNGAQEKPGVIGGGGGSSPSGSGKNATTTATHDNSLLPNPTAPDTNTKSPRLVVSKVIKNIRHRAKSTTRHLTGNKNNGSDSDLQTGVDSISLTEDGKYATKYPNLTLEIVVTSTPLQSFLSKSRTLNHTDLVICGRNRNTRLPYFDHSKEIEENDVVRYTHVQSNRRKGLGDLGDRVIGIGSSASIMVIQDNNKEDTESGSNSDAGDSSDARSLRSIEDGIQQFGSNEKKQS